MPPAAGGSSVLSSMGFGGGGGAAASELQPERQTLRIRVVGEADVDGLLGGGEAWHSSPRGGE